MLSARSREQAIALGLQRYFTGEPCRQGHIAERHVTTGLCFECVREYRAANLEKVRERNREAARKYRAADPEGYKERCRKWRAENQRRIQEYARENKDKRAAWYAKNKDQIIAKQAARRAADPEKAREYAREWYAKNKDRISSKRAERYARNKIARLAAITNDAA
jgi:hypothetical protein